jgi:hypothetical protein
LWSAATLAAAVVLLRTVVALPQTPNSKSLGSGGGGGGGSGQTSNNIDFTEERDAEDLRYKQVIQAWGGNWDSFPFFCLSDSPSLFTFPPFHSLVFYNHLSFLITATVISILKKN